MIHHEKPSGSKQRFERLSRYLNHAALVVLNNDALIPMRFGIGDGNGRMPFAAFDWVWMTYAAVPALAEGAVTTTPITHRISTDSASVHAMSSRRIRPRINAAGLWPKCQPSPHR